MSSRRCFTAIHCPLHSKCKLSHEPHTNGYFTPTAVGEHCYHFQTLEIDDVDLTEKLTRMAGAHD